jgi:hypothetical protein
MKYAGARYAVRLLLPELNATKMHGLVIAKSSDRAWRANIERHFGLYLTPFLAEYRAFRISLEQSTPTGFVCELRGERRSGGDLHIEVVHDDGETAIALACARARREIRRAGRLMRRHGASAGFSASAVIGHGP